MGDLGTTKETNIDHYLGFRQHDPPLAQPVIYFKFVLHNLIETYYRQWEAFVEFIRPFFDVDNPPVIQQPLLLLLL